MARIKYGANIKDMCDVQNVVTACILRAREPLTISELVREVCWACVDSSVELSVGQLTEMVEDTITALRRVGLVAAYDGKYFSYPIEV